MSTAAKFKYYRSFRDCYANSGSVPAPGSPDPGQIIYCGPFTLTQMMALYWNTESVSVNGHTLTGYNSDVMAQPSQRVCATYGGGKFTNYIYGSFSSPEELCEIPFDAIVRVGSNYYVGVGYYLYSADASHFFSLNSTADNGGTNTLVATYSATVFGVSMNLYLYRIFAGPAPSNPGLTITANYYTY